MEHPGELRDTRRTYTFYMDDALIDHFAPQIGVTGLAVYALLARHAKQGRAFPAWTRIAHQLGIGRATVQRALTTLETVGLIIVEKRKSPRGDKATSLYILQDLSHLRSIGFVVGHALVQDDAEALSMRGSVADYARTIEKNTKIDNIQEVERGSVADYAPLLDKSPKTDESVDGMRGSVADYRGSVADYPLRSEGISLKEEEQLHLGSEVGAVVDMSTTCGPSVAPSVEDAPPTSAKKPRKTKQPPSPWLLDDPDVITFHDWIMTQTALREITPPVDYEWWCDMSNRINGLPDPAWLERRYAKMEMWIKDNPKKKPTPKGTPRFVGDWLEGDYERDRRQRLPSPQTKEVHFHYNNNDRRR